MNLIVVMNMFFYILTDLKDNVNSILNIIRRKLEEVLLDFSIQYFMSYGLVLKRILKKK